MTEKEAIEDMIKRSMESAPQVSELERLEARRRLVEKLTEHDRSIYIAGPFSGDEVGNTHTAIVVFHGLMDLGFMPYLPHLFLHAHAVRPRSYDDWMRIDEFWLDRCARMFFIGPSPGALKERARSESHGKRTLTTMDEALAFARERGWRS